MINDIVRDIGTAQTPDDFISLVNRIRRVEIDLWRANEILKDRESKIFKPEPIVPLSAT